MYSNIPAVYKSWRPFQMFPVFLFHLLDNEYNRSTDDKLFLISTHSLWRSLVSFNFSAPGDYKSTLQLWHFRGSDDWTAVVHPHRDGWFPGWHDHVFNRFHHALYRQVLRATSCRNNRLIKDTFQIFNLLNWFL